MAAPIYADFAPAAYRHYADAQLLQHEQRHANADHLAGVAAECGLKAILVDHLGGHTDARGRPRDANLDFGYHLPRLWDELARTISGRSANQFAFIAATSNPFDQHSWDISERYSDGEHITELRTIDHMAAAKMILSAYEHGV